MSTELEVIPKEENAQQLMRRATDVAGVCKEIVLKTACNIQGKKYVKCEGWMSIATAHGCMASSRDVEKIEGGWRAIGEIKRISDGLVLATAEGFVGLDETKTWGQRPEYACRAMAQTRAISRACRAAFAHVVVLMDAGLSTTPAEEVPDGGFDAAPPIKAPVRPVSATKEHYDKDSTGENNLSFETAVSTKPLERTFEEVVDGKLPDAAWKKVMVPKFIKKYAGMTLGEMEVKDLRFWCEQYKPKPWRGEIQQADKDFRIALDLALNDLNEDEAVRDNVLPE